MRLIDADALIENIGKIVPSTDYYEFASQICNAIRNQPTAYDVDKVVAELEKRSNEVISNIFAYEEDDHIGIYNDGLADGYEYAIDIVNQLAEEYAKTPTPIHPIPIDTQQYIAELEKQKNNGWIPCSKRLPDVGVTVLCYWKKYDRYDNTTSYYYSLMHRNEDCQWLSDFGMCNGDVIAWQPLPEPYKAGVKNDY